MKRPVRKLLAFLSAAAMLCNVPLLPAGAAYAAEQIGSDYDSMIRGKDHNIYIESGTADAVTGGTQLVVIGSDGEKQLVSLASGATGIDPYASTSMVDYNFLSPTPAAYSFDFFDPSFRIGNDLNVLVTQTADGYALCDLEGKLISESYPALTYMGEDFFITQTSVQEEAGPVGVIRSDGSVVIAPSETIKTIFLTQDGKNFLVQSTDGDYFTDLDGKTVSEVYQSIGIRDFYGSDMSQHRDDSGTRRYSSYRLTTSTLILKNADGMEAIAFHSMEPETELCSYYQLESNWYYNANDPASVQYYFTGKDADGNEVVYYDLDGNQLDSNPRVQNDGSSGTSDTSAYVPKLQNYWEFYLDSETHTIRSYNEDKEFGTLPEEYTAARAYSVDGTMYFVGQADGYFTVFDSALNVMQERIEGYYDKPQWFYVESSETDENGNAVRTYGAFTAEKGVVLEPTFASCGMFQGYDRGFASTPDKTVFIDWEGNVYREFDRSFGLLSGSAYAPTDLISNSTDAATGATSSVIYNAVTDTVDYQQDGQYDRVTQSAGDYLIVTNYEERDTSLWTSDAMYHQGLVRKDGTEVITPSNDMFITLDNYLFPSITRDAYGFDLDTSFYCEVGQTKQFAVIRNHKDAYGARPQWTNASYQGVYVDTTALDTAYSTANGCQAAAKLSDGNYAVVRDGKWGLADADGTAITEAKYDAIYEYQNGIAYAINYADEELPYDRYNYETGEQETGTEPYSMPHLSVIDKNGKTWVDQIYDIRLDVELGYWNNIAKYRDSDTLYVRIPSDADDRRNDYITLNPADLFNDMTAKYGYDAAVQCGDLWVVTKDGLKGIVTETNEIVLPIEFADVLHFTADKYSLWAAGEDLGERLSDPGFTSPIQALDDGSSLVSVRTAEGKIQVYRLAGSSEPAGLPGDLDGNGKIDAADATEVLIAAAKRGAGDDMGLTAAQIARVDINGNGAPDAGDATAILQYAAAVGAGDTITPEEFFAQE